MRHLLLLVAVAILGCVGHSGSQRPFGSGVPQTAIASEMTSDQEKARRLATAKKYHLTVVDQNGERVFCRSNLATGSHVQRDTRCFTATQLDQIELEGQRQVELMLSRQNNRENPGGSNK